jgi:Fur family transcriptional regulator, ferric uptake regulator
MSKIENNRDKIKYKSWVSSLKKYGYKLTDPRDTIIDYLSKESGVKSAEEVYLELNKINPQIGIATIYRTLDLLSNLELINKINFGSSKSLYVFSKNNNKDLSIYLVCENCGKVIVNNKCLNNAIRIRLIDDAEKNVFKNCNLKINNFQIFFSGLCDKCSTSDLNNR